ncbi:hypothetical protein FA95DRAFT_667322 [Auriscalpium vulgare]|uniref:Uncharacterized protein n=1 Tax=Auriscalpium vulgare TaxID=40419 RepID=A0ACB8RCW1_9AGAM|nr:hypothetical protein FA95DRAFT_667322 [Auriscalpium vulgare]
MSNFDKDTYNSAADTRFDDAAFEGEEQASRIPVGARGADNQPTNVDATREDREATQSEQTGRVSKNEAQGLVSELREDEKNVSGYTRGRKVDAFKQERTVDRQAEEATEQDEMMA